MPAFMNVRLWHKALVMGLNGSFRFYLSIELGPKKRSIVTQSRFDAIRHQPLDREPLRWRPRR